MQHCDQVSVVGPLVMLTFVIIFFGCVWMQMRESSRRYNLLVDSNVRKYRSILQEIEKYFLETLDEKNIAVRYMPPETAVLHIKEIAKIEKFMCMIDNLRKREKITDDQ